MVVENFANFSTLVTINSDSYLDEARTHITIPNGY